MEKKDYKLFKKLKEQIEEEALIIFYRMLEIQDKSLTSRETIEQIDCDDEGSLDICITTDIPASCGCCGGDNNYYYIKECWLWDKNWEKELIQQMQKKEDEKKEVKRKLLEKKKEQEKLNTILKKEKDLKLLQELKEKYE